MTALLRDDALFLIAGPCVLEDDALNLRVGEHLARLAERVPGGIVYKASFDKANRSNAGAARGPGMHEGLEALARVKAATGLPILTDVHLPEQCAVAAQVVDVLQIPAFLCRQTDLLVAAGATNKPVNVKKGQWMHPDGTALATATGRPTSRSTATSGQSSPTNATSLIAISCRSQIARSAESFCACVSCARSVMPSSAARSRTLSLTRPVTIATRSPASCRNFTPRPSWMS